MVNRKCWFKIRSCGRLWRFCLIVLFKAITFINAFLHDERRNHVIVLCIKCIELCHYLCFLTQETRGDWCTCAALQSGRSWARRVCHVSLPFSCQKPSKDLCFTRIDVALLLHGDGRLTRGCKWPLAPQHYLHGNQWLPR